MLTRLAFHLICVMPVASARMLNGLSTRFSQIAADQRPGVTRRTNGVEGTGLSWTTGNCFAV